jgi:hypothetical protein
MKLLKYNDYSKEILAEEFLKLVGSTPIMEGKEKKIDDSTLKQTLTKLSTDLKFNLGLILTFGTGVKAIYPIVSTFVEKGLIKVEFTTENIVLICITSLSIVYLEEKGNKAGSDHILCDICNGEDKDCLNCKGDGHVSSQVTKADAQTMLTELKMRGVGNGVIKNLVNFFHKVSGIGQTIVDGLNKLKSTGITIIKNIPSVIDGFLDMLGYTQLLVPILNAVSVLCGTYNLTWDNIWTNLAAIGAGLTTLIARRQYQKAWNYLKNLNSSDKKSNKSDNLEKINEQ